MPGRPRSGGVRAGGGGRPGRQANGSTANGSTANGSTANGSTANGSTANGSTDRFGGLEDQPADPESVARLICLRLLTAAPRTRAQLADALGRKGVPGEAATAVLARLADVGLINDAMFASSWVESRHHGRGLARRALAAELDRRGVARSDVQDAVDQLSPETEHATAVALVERRLASTAGQPAQVRVRKLAGMLARKGYPAGLAYRVVREALERAGHDPVAAGLDGDEPFGSDCADEST